jgi:hypothetical protein
MPPQGTKETNLWHKKRTAQSQVPNLPAMSELDILMPPMKKQKCKQNVCACAKQLKDSPGCKRIANEEYSKSAPIMCNQRSNADSTTKKLQWFVADNATVLHIRVQSMHAASTTMTAMQRAQQAEDVYSCVYTAAAIHGIPIIDPRTDSFVCVVDADDPSCAGDPVGQLLRVAFAADLTRRLISRPAQLQARMGMASGPTAVIGTSPAVVGEAANIAADMARLGAVAAVAVHESALLRWAAAARHAPPAAAPVECGGGRSGRAAVFDLETGCFRPAAAALASPPAAVPKIAIAAAAQPLMPRCAGRRLCWSASFA